MKAGVYDRFWSTLGGGERFAAGIAEALAEEHDVELLAIEDVDLDVLGERLGCDLAGVGVRRIGDDLDAVERATADLDLFVNASYLSSERSSARHSIYVVHFPAALHGADSPRRRLTRAVDESTRRWRHRVAGRSGLHPWERASRHSIRWTDGRAVLDAELPPATRVPVHVVLGRYLPGNIEPVDVEVRADGQTIATGALTPVRSRFDQRRVTVLSGVAVGRPDGSPVEIEVVSSSFLPTELLGAADNRRLGVPVIDVVAGEGAVPALARRFPAAWENPSRADFLATYDLVLSNSAFTQEWVRLLWDADSDVLHPPVTMFDAGPKDRIISSVGRFFREGGHSKKQLELVRAFRQLVEGGVDGWELHLAGGCAPAAQPYLDEVRAAAEGLPVVFHVDVPGRELADLYARSSIYWHATGLGEDPRRHPEAFEHFGITTVEAMSAGAVPVVIGAAGQVESVEHGVSGFHFADVDELVARTRQLIDAPELLGTMSAAARERATTFSNDAFAERLRHHVASVVDRVD
ncbi:glycosyltransferase family 4 protein [Actinomarinicola tropica]|uniref:Glycosyltransferase n=1 Tax=Actinomarinicola tropica TaxID=2789776 RepID=A0A5Q2RLP1_9ACTN|nr:glycosyltransferase family 4 protein [Actinomarinicola tropica]QGG95842.1 glycosyltransferase [Actinomarinicola tropica]